jgi:hypothetical protein
MSEIPQLLPCPYCDGAASFATAEDNRRYRCRVVCTACGAEAGGTAFRNDDYNANAWNTRVENAKLKGVLASIRREASDLLSCHIETPNLAKDALRRMRAFIDGIAK